MSVGEYWTMNIWQVRAGQRGNVLEELTKKGIVPQYGKVPGVLSVKLMRIIEGDGAGSDSEQYIALTIYESREAYNKWWTSETRERIEMGQGLQNTLDSWLRAAAQIRVHRSVVVVDEEYARAETPPDFKLKSADGPIF